MAYVKLFASILDSSLWERDLATKVVWITVLAMSDRDGVVSASVPGLARRAGVTIEQCQAALDIFLSPDPYSRTPDHEGRRITKVDGGWELLNHQKYRKLESAEDRREKDAERKRRERRRKASLESNDSSTMSRDTSANVTLSRDTSADVTVCHAESRHVTGSDQNRSEKEREGASAPTHARAREGQDSDPVVSANPPSADESGPRRAVRDADATHAAPAPPDARKTHPGAIPDPANSNDLAAVAATLPDWAVAQVGTAQMTTGYRSDPKVSWARFVAHIFACREQGQARRIGQAEWLKWLTNESRYERGGQPQRESAHKPERRVLNKPAPKKTPEELAAEAAEREANCAATLEMIAKWDAEAEEERKRREANPLPRKARFM